MNYKIEKVKAPGRDQVELLGETYEKGKPQGEEAGKWRQKLAAVRKSLNIYRMVNAIFTAKMGMAVKKGKNRLN